jgi:broad specificity phosphatase PhoE
MIRAIEVEEDTRPQAWLVRHGETEWSKSGRHTGRTDVPLTDDGRSQARRLKERLGLRRFARVYCSPLSRAIETARLAGYPDVEKDPDLREWHYGEYEGLTTPEIRKRVPGWSVWTDPVPGGETVEEVAARVDRVIARVRAADGNVALFAHGHVLRVLAARWLDLPPTEGRLFALATATVSVLGWERETPVVERWNAPADGA